MALYFTSDQHICLTHPRRGQRFARFLGLLDPKIDRLVIAGDLCDFWFASRETKSPKAASEPGLLALRRFIEAGGQVTILPGNHDAHLEPFYREKLGLSFAGDLDLEIPAAGSAGKIARIRVVHGHLLGGRSKWKGLMEGQAFLAGFRALPALAANRLAGLLQKYNSRNRHEDNLRHFRVYSKHVRYDRPANGSHYDIFILGHVHQTICTAIALDPAASEAIGQATQMVVLGHWFNQASWFRIDPDLSWNFWIWSDDAPQPEPVRDRRVEPPRSLLISQPHNGQSKNGGRN